MQLVATAVSSNDEQASTIVEVLVNDVNDEAPEFELVSSLELSGLMLF